MYSFEDKIQEIDREIAKRKSRWRLKAVAWMDFSDVSQIIRIHINNKWHLWDQSRDFLPWVNKVITHRITNLLRDLYMNIARPCVGCPANEGGDHAQGEGYCRIYVKQCSACPLYANWEKSRKNAHDIKLPVSIENHTQDIFSIPEQSSDILGKVATLHARMKDVLSPIQYRIYKYLYIDGKPEMSKKKILDACSIYVLSWNEHSNSSIDFNFVKSYLNEEPVISENDTDTIEVLTARILKLSTIRDVLFSRWVEASTSAEGAVLNHLNLVKSTIEVAKRKRDFLLHRKPLVVVGDPEEYYAG